MEAGFTEEQAKLGITEYENDLAEDSSLREELGLDGTATLDFAALSDTSDSTADSSGFDPKTVIIIATGSVVAVALVAVILIIAKNNSKNSKKTKKK